MNPQISIVVPVYNAEEFLHRCIDSILSQTFQDFEIILINDGSIDKSGEICDEYVRKDNRIKVVHKENARASAARNDGIKLATGKYLGLVDADDWIEQEMYQEMHEVAEKYDLDFAMCDFNRTSDVNLMKQTQPIRGGYYSKSDLEIELFPCLIMYEHIEFPPTISNCICLFNREFLSSNNIYYDEDIHYCEDALFGPKVMFHADKFFYLKGQYYYNYCYNPNSTARTYHENKWETYLRINDRLVSYFGKDSIYDFTRQIKINMLYFTLNTLAQTRYASNDRKKRIEMIREIMDHPKVREVFTDFILPDVSWKLKLTILMIKYKMAVAYGLLSLIR